MNRYHAVGFYVALGHSLFVKLMKEVFEISADGLSMADIIQKMKRDAKLERQHEVYQADKELLTRYQHDKPSLNSEEPERAMRVEIAREYERERQLEVYQADNEHSRDANMTNLP